MTYHIVQSGETLTAEMLPDLADGTITYCAEWDGSAPYVAVWKGAMADLTVALAGWPMTTWDEYNALNTPA